MNQIKTGAIISYIALFLNILIGLLYTPWMINAIGRADYGLYLLAMSVISLFVFDFGLGIAITRFVSKYLAEGKQYMVDRLLGIVFKLYLLGDLIILISLIVIYFFLPSIYQGLTPSEMENFRVVYILAALFSVISFPFIPLNGIIASYEKFIQLKLCDLFHKLIIVVLMTCCLLAGGGLFSLVIVNSIAGIIIIIAKLFVLGKKNIISIQWKYMDKSMLKLVFSFSVWITVIQLSQRCIFNISPSILAALTTSSAITIMGIAITIEGYTFTFGNAINGMFLPRVSRMLVNNRDEIVELMIRVGRIQIYIIGLICLGLICVGREFIQVWLGNGYDEVYTCALFIVLPSFIQLPQEIGSNAIMAEGKVKLLACTYLLMALINIILAYPMTKYLGVLGLCVSIMIAYIARTICMDIIFYRKIGINVFEFFKQSYIKILPSLVVAFLLYILFIRFYSQSGFIGLLVKGFVCLLFYLLSVWFLSMNSYEKNLILNPIRNLIRKINNQIMS